MVDPMIPKNFWEQRLSNHFDLRGVGHIAFGTTYNNWLYRRKANCLSAALRNVTLRRREVLDVGCGTGFFVEWYTAKGARITGVDITDISIRVLKEKYGGDFYVADISDRDLLIDKQFDIVNVWDVFYHIIDDAAFKQAIDNISRRLRPSGLVVLDDFLSDTTDNLLTTRVKARCLSTYETAFAEHSMEFLQCFPLFNFLDTHHLGACDNRLGWLYYILDQTFCKLSPGNLAVGLWQHRPASRDS
jgi:SAM-dependent methyltransferase